MKKYPLIMLLGALAASPALAEQAAKPGSVDGRVRTVVYNERDVVRIIGHYGFQTMIQFAGYESIENISIGDSLAWQVVPNERRNLLFVKPVEKNAETNLTIITTLPSATKPGQVEQRVYNFSLEAKKASKHTDRSMTWTLRFHYPQDDQALLLLKRQRAERTRGALVNPDVAASSPASWNFDYTFAGDTSQVPKRIFDNGQFTYFEFDQTTDTPAIFLVGKNGNESLVNYQVEGKYIVVHRVARQFTLRNGDVVTCIFNEAYSGEPDLDMNSPQKRKTSSRPAPRPATHTNLLVAAVRE